MYCPNHNLLGDNTMKLNRFVAMAAIALLVVGAMGAIAARSFAQTATAPAAQSPDCAANQADDTTEAQSAGADTDAVDMQCGDRNEADADNIQEGNQTGPDTSAEVNESSDEQETTPAGTPAITAEAAQKTAEAYLNAGTATQVELDDENGQLVYSVEFNGTDVKVDAMTGAVLRVETGQD